jgi:galactose mutarotase-like enzyme
MTEPRTRLTTAETVELRDSTGATVAIAPARGALVTRFRTGGQGREVLYLDEATLLDASKNVRGGIPLLFPSPGKLADGRYTRDGSTGALKQHGFARDLPWAVSDLGPSSVTLSLRSSDATRAAYPWDFTATLRASLADGALRLAFRVANDGPRPIPFGFGIHPYFLVDDKAGATISTAATRAFDNVSGAVVPFHGFSLGSGETDLHLLDHGGTSSTLTADGHALTVRGSEELRRWVVWTLPGKPFVCVEPWTSPGDALNSGEGLVVLEPGAARELWVSIEPSAS